MLDVGRSLQLLCLLNQVLVSLEIPGDPLSPWGAGCTSEQIRKDGG